MKITTIITLFVMLLAVIRQSFTLAAAGLSPSTQAQLAATPSGRIVLHLICACRDRKFRWHGRGMTRELLRA